MGRPAALHRDQIINVAAQLVAEQGAKALSARKLGELLGCDPSALYRHFANMGELEREVGDLFLADVDVREAHGGDWRTSIRRICIDLRSVMLRQPRFAALVRSAPTRLENELLITDAMIRELLRGGLDEQQAAAAYHAIIELTVGSAAIDASLAIEPAATRTRLYRDWRKDYAGLDPKRFPSAVKVAPALYEGTADHRFEAALDMLLGGIAALRR